MMHGPMNIKFVKYLRVLNAAAEKSSHLSCTELVTLSPNMKNTRAHHPQNEQSYSKMNGMGGTDCPVSVEHSNMSHFLH
jgi:hypothetical protein